MIDGSASSIVHRLSSGQGGTNTDSPYLVLPLIQYNTVMPNLTLQINPSQLVLGPFREQQLCYLLLTISARGSGASRPVNWALIADASRSMRIPIVDEAQFRALLRETV